MVSSRENITFEDVDSLLLIAEAPINHNQQTLSLPNASANVVTRQSNYNGIRSRGTNFINANRGWGRNTTRGFGHSNLGTLMLVSF